jgi:hypothetical protein
MPLTRTITFKHRKDGVLTDVTSAVLSDPTDTFGVKRDDTSAVVVANNAAMTRQSTGVYVYTFDDPGVAMTAYIKYVFQGATYRIEDDLPAIGAVNAAPAGQVYFEDIDEARALAATLPSSRLAAFRAASDVDAWAALAEASSRIDARRGGYQGRKYDPEQVLEFPRVKNATDPRFTGAGPGSWPLDEAAATQSFPGDIGDTPAAAIWDWDSTSNAATVPRKVKLATLHEANSILDGQRAAMLDAQHNGLASNRSARPARATGRRSTARRASRCCASTPTR